MNWSKHSPEGFNYTVWIDNEDNWYGLVKEFNPSTDIEVAWTIIERLYETMKYRMFVGHNFYPLWEARCKNDWYLREVKFNIIKELIK